MEKRPPNIVSRLLLMVILPTISLAQSLVPPPIARYARDDVIECFEEGTRNDRGGVLNCEASGLHAIEDTLYFVMDKAYPGGSTLMSVALDRDFHPVTKAQTVEAPILNRAQKLEDLTSTPDGAYVIATTAFDRIKPGGDWDPYNMLVYWPTERPAEGKVVDASSNPGTSVHLRAPIARAISGPGDVPPYFKIEGVATAPGGKLLFGIREIGPSYKSPTYVVKVLSVSYEVSRGRLMLGDDWQSILDFRPPQAMSLGTTLGLSSIEYDFEKDVLILLTSYEKGPGDEGLGAYLWIYPTEHLTTGAAPLLVRDAQGRALHFAHKAEGVVPYGGRLIAVIYDDDRELGRSNIQNPRTQFNRRPHEAGFAVIDLYLGTQGMQPVNVGTELD